MAVFKSKYNELSFYVDGQMKSFSNGHYSTDNAKEIKVLDGIVDAYRVDEPKETKPEEKAEVKPKKPAARKASGK